MRDSERVTVATAANLLGVSPVRIIDRGRRGDFGELVHLGRRIYLSLPGLRQALEREAAELEALAAKRRDLLAAL